MIGDNGGTSTLGIISKREKILFTAEQNNSCIKLQKDELFVPSDVEKVKRSDRWADLYTLVSNKSSLTAEQKSTHIDVVNIS